MVAARPANAAQVIELRGGAEVRGTVLSEKPDKVFVDLGFTVLSIPRDDILHLTELDANGAMPTDDAAASGDLFRPASSDDIERSVRDNVARVEEAVVQIRTPVALGSGFIIDPSGYIVTNEHVIAGETRLTVTQFRHTGKELQRVTYDDVRIVALDSRQDLALLKLEEPGKDPLPTVAVADSYGLDDGQSVFAIGSPLGLERTVSQGIISLKNRVMEGQLYLQTTTQINPGNSGGPLFNLRGEVVGVNNMKAMLVGVEGLNFAIPSATLKNFLRNRQAFAFDPRHPNAGYRYLEPPKPAAGDSAKLPEKHQAGAP